MNGSHSVVSSVTAQKTQALERSWFAGDKHTCLSCSLKSHLSCLYGFKGNCFNWHCQQVPWFCFRFFKWGLTCIGLTKLFPLGAAESLERQRDSHGGRMVAKPQREENEREGFPSVIYIYISNNISQEQRESGISHSTDSCSFHRWKGPYYCTSGSRFVWQDWSEENSLLESF